MFGRLLCFRDYCIGFWVVFWMIVSVVVSCFVSGLLY